MKLRKTKKLKLLIFYGNQWKKSAKLFDFMLTEMKEK